MPNEKKGKVLVVTTTSTPKSTMRGPVEEARKIVEEGIPVEKLRAGFASFMESLSEIVEAGYEEVGEYTLDEISFSAEIGGNGEFKLMGTGLGVSAKSGVTFKLRRAAK